MTKCIWAVRHTGMIIIGVIMLLQMSCAEPTCRGGTYYSDDGRCVPCSKPPKTQTTNSVYSMYCEGLCGKGKMGLYCGQDCSDGCNKTFCNRWTGECIYGCRANRYGTKCDIPCEHCAFCVDVAEQECVCNNGYYGVQCNQKCPVNCKNNTCTSNGTCHLGCSSGWVGNKCDQQCLNCVKDSDSNYNCLDGWYGTTCNQSCRVRCSKGLCSRNGSCLFGCVEGLFGETCEEACPDTCKSRSCKANGSCESCHPGYRGSRCDELCGKTCKTCQQDGYLCMSCTSGHFGNSCQFQCKNCRKGICHITNGSCAQGCKNGMHGPYCDKKCNRNCRMLTVDTCLMDSGSCNHGCRSGWFGTQCDRECATGCRYPCDRETGECNVGCKPSLYGSFCNISCSDHCLNSNCTPTIDGSHIVCVGGCREGWSGPYCERANSSDWTLIAFTVLAVGILGCLIGVIIRKLVWRLRRQRGLYLSVLDGSVAYTAGTRTTTTTTTTTTDGYPDVGVEDYEDIAEVVAVKDYHVPRQKYVTANDQHEYRGASDAIYEVVQ